MSDKNKVKDDGIYMVYENSNVLRGNSLLLDSRVIDFDVAQKCLYSAREEGRLICNDEVLVQFLEVLKDMADVTEQRMSDVPTDTESDIRFLKHIGVAFEKTAPLEANKYFSCAANMLEVASKFEAQKEIIRNLVKDKETLEKRIKEVEGNNGLG